MREERDISIIAYVIMENHLHAIVQGEQLTKKIGSFKSFAARKIIDMMKQDDHTFWLQKIRSMNTALDFKQDFIFWERGFYPKQIIGDDMLYQKIEYIHNNPVRRGYVDKPEDWRYSSARNYAGMEGLISVDLV